MWTQRIGAYGQTNKCNGPYGAATVADDVPLDLGRWLGSYPPIAAIIGLSAGSAALGFPFFIDNTTLSSNSKV
jgi:hypothetical protein